MLERDLIQENRADDPVVHRRVRPGEKDALVGDILPFEVAPDRVVRIQHMVHLFKEWDDVDPVRPEPPDPVCDGHAAFTETSLLLPDDDIGIIAVDVINGSVGCRHREDDLEYRGTLVPVEEARRVERPRDALKRLEEYLCLGRLNLGVWDPERQEDVPAESLLPEERIVPGEEFPDHKVVDLFSLTVPHLFGAPQVGIGVVRLLDLVFTAEFRALGKERQVDVVRVLGAHTLRYP